MLNGYIQLFMATNVLCESNTQSALDVLWYVCPRKHLNAFGCCQSIYFCRFALLTIHISIQCQFGVVFTNTKQYLILSLCSVFIQCSHFHRTSPVARNTRTHTHILSVTHLQHVNVWVCFQFFFIFFFFPLFPYIFFFFVLSSSCIAHLPNGKKQQIRRKVLYAFNILCAMFAFRICI